MSGFFYAIGGANYEKRESIIIDLDIIKETKKKNPIVLLINAANYDLDKAYKFKQYYESLGANVHILPLNPNKEIIEEEFMEADVIYLSGGITCNLRDFYLKYDLYNTTINAYKNGKIIVGVSAGAILFFEYGFGDKEAYLFNLETVNHKLTQGIGFFKGIFCPHYQNNGLLSFHDEVKNHNFDAYALENGAGLKINDDGFRVIKNKGCNAFKFDYRDNHKLIYLKKDILYSDKLFK